METHLININIPHTLIECILRIEDFSNYSELLPYANATLQVLVPGFEDCVTFTMVSTPAVEEGFVFNLNACALGIQTDNCGLEQLPLPDGIYKIQYSLQPNHKLNVTKHHLRTTILEKTLAKIYMSLDLDCCEPSSEKHSKLHLLQEISSYILAAQYYAELANNCTKAMELYECAKHLIGKLTCKNC